MVHATGCISLYFIYTVYTVQLSYLDHLEDGEFSLILVWGGEAPVNQPLPPVRCSTCVEVEPRVQC
jgi:hypothetical protein